MANKLTDAKIRGFKPPDRGQVEHSDSDVPGLRIRIGSTGTKTFILRRRVGDKVRNITIGRYGPRLTLKDARRKARQVISDLEAGSTVKAEPTRGDTIAQLWPRYIEQKKRRRSIAETERIFRHYIVPAIGDRMADSVTRRDVTEMVDAIAADAPAMARAVHAQLSAFYSWALPSLDRLPANPCQGARRPERSPPRNRVLSDAELRALWQVLDREPLPWGEGGKLLLLTDARRLEVFDADRAEFDLEARTWTIPPARSKNGVASVVPLSHEALQIVARIPVIEGSGKLFPTRTKDRQADTGPSGFSKAQARLRSELETAMGGPVEHWTLHDLRRTVATGLQRLGVRFEVTEAILNHVGRARGGVAGVYQHHDWSTEKREALEKWAAEIRRIVDQTVE